MQRRDSVRFCWSFQLAAWLCAALSVLSGHVSAADAYYVTPTGSVVNSGASWETAFSNVQDAAALATSAGDAIYLQSGVYSNASQIVISNAAGVTVFGGCYGGAAAGSNDYSGTNSILTRTAGEMRIVYACASTVTVAGVTVSDGYFSSGANNGAGLYFTNCAVMLTNCVVSDNTNLNSSTTVNGYGGGLYCVGGSLAAYDCVFNNNTMKRAAMQSPGGGALAGRNTPMTIAGTHFTGNTVEGGGVSYINGEGGAIYSAGAVLVIVTNCLFRDNFATGTGNYGYGGAMHVSGGSAEIVYSSFISNRTGRSSNYGRGGAVSLTGLQLATVRSNYFLDNYITGSGEANGSALFVSSCSTTMLDRCLIESRGKVANAEHVYVSGGNNTYISNTTVRSNAYYRGIIFAGATASRLVMTNCLAMNNGSDGIRLTAGTGVVANCTFANNAGCGASWTGSGSLGMTNCLLAQNIGDGFLMSAGTATVANCSLVDNGGWGLNRSGGTGTVFNSIAWGNVAGGFVSNESINVTYSCSQNAPYGPGTGNIQGDPVFANVPGCYYLSSNGLAGQTVSSPCIDAGNGTAEDWGFTNRTTRTDGASDSGIVDIGYHYTNGVAESLIRTITNCYVDAVNGNDASNGLSWAAAWQSLTHALSNVAANATVNVATGTYNVASGEIFPLTVQMANLTLAATHTNPALTMVDNAGANGQRVLQASGKGTILLKGMTVRRGYFASGMNNGAGLCFLACAVMLTNCVVSENTNLNSSTVASGYGGGMYCAGGSLAVYDCVFSNNSIQATALTPKPLGGGALAGCNTPMIAADSHFVDNAAEGNADRKGGAIYSAGAVLVIVTNCLFRDNFATGTGNYGYGGAMHVSGGSAEIVYSSFISNRTGRSSNYGKGGAVSLIGLQLATVRSNYFLDNYITGSGEAYGSALYVSSCSTTMLDRCLIESRGKVANAEHVYVSGGNNTDILNTTVRNNSAKRGIYFYGSGDNLLALTHSLIVKNGSDGLFIAGGTATVANCTIATNAGWGITNDGVLTVKNSIVWTNALGGIATNATTAITYSDVQDGTLPGAGNMSQDPLFVGLVNGDFHVMSVAGSYNTNGQWTTYAHMSPCIDAGEPGSLYALEPKPNGGRVNLGAYGNTPYASRSSRGMMISIW